MEINRQIRETSKLVPLEDKCSRSSAMLPEPTSHKEQDRQSPEHMKILSELTIQYTQKSPPQDTKPQELRLHNPLITQLVSFLIN